MNNTQLYAIGYPVRSWFSYLFAPESCPDPCVAATIRLPDGIKWNMDENNSVVGIYYYTDKTTAHLMTDAEFEAICERVETEIEECEDC